MVPNPTRDKTQQIYLEFAHFDEFPFIFTW